MARTRRICPGPRIGAPGDGPSLVTAPRYNTGSWVVARARGAPVPFPGRGGGLITDQDVLRRFGAAVAARNLGAPPTRPSELFRLVRDLPYRRPSSPDALAVIHEWCGTCSTKHGLLQRLLAASGIPSRLMMATYVYRWTATAPPPAGIAAVLADGPVPDVHNFLEVGADGTWAALDATWPLGGERLGFSVDAAWTPGIPQQVACLTPYRAWPVPADQDPSTYKARVVRSWCGADGPRRERLIAALSEAIRDSGLA